MNRSRKNWVLPAATAGFGLLIALVLVETIPRLVPGLMPKKLQAVQRIYDARNTWEDMMQGDKDVGFVLKPGLELTFPSESGNIDIRTTDVGVGGLGQRDIGTQPPYDAIALGDSFTFCDDSTVANCWVRLLASRTGLSIADLGVNGYSNMAEARVLDKVGKTLRPKLILVGFFPNDFKDNVHFNNWSKSGTDDYWTWMRRQRRSDSSDWLAGNSILYRLIDAARRYGARDTFEYKEGNLNFVFRDDDWWQGVVEQAGVTNTYEITQEALSGMAAAAKQLDARLVVLLFPFKEQVYWDVARKYQARGDAIDEAKIDAPLRRIGEYLGRQQIDYCDLTGDLRSHAHEEQLYLKTSAHWTAAGNRVAADSIVRCLERKAIVTARS
ncbi:MAG TPA: hypothetical protein VN634_03825 [Candidatus Limnocylindrales bacterium]|nr:hypothetical protein [Candidatus Limnocylindrales bacterium]